MNVDLLQKGIFNHTRLRGGHIEYITDRKTTRWKARYRRGIIRKVAIASIQALFLVHCFTFRVAYLHWKTCYCIPTKVTIKYNNDMYLILIKQTTAIAKNLI